MKFPTEIQNKTILDICRRGGVLTPVDAGKYVENLRRQNQFTLDDLAEKMRRSKSLPSRLETASTERIKLVDVLSLDNFWQQEGKLFAIYWRAGEFNVKITQSNKWTEGEAKIGSVLVAVARWQQFLKWSDNSWIYDLRNRIYDNSVEKSPVILN